VTDKIRSAWGPLIIGTVRNWGNLGFWPRMDRIFGLEFWDVVQRRGTHVNTPELGSRDGEIVFGGI
jgi:hypothetical protein